MCKILLCQIEACVVDKDDLKKGLQQKRRKKRSLKVKEEDCL